MKAISSMVLIVVILVVAIMAFLTNAPAIAMGWYNQITGTKPNCNDDPYNGNCICNIGQRKIDVPWLGIQKRSCENVELLLIDPDSPTFEDDSIAFIENYFAYYCGNIYSGTNCGSLCPDIPGPANPYPDDMCMSALWGYSSEGKRLVNIECIVVDEWYSEGKPAGGYIPWRMEFLVESETDTPVVYEVFVDKNYYYNKEQDKKCAHQSVCDYYGNPEMCVGNLVFDIIPSPMYMVLPFNIGTGYPAPR